MNFFKKSTPEKKPQAVQSIFSTEIPREGDALPASLKAYSQFIKRVNCPQCGAPKTLPSKTAYLYCDFCGSLMDYDFRAGNAGTNAGLSNTVYHRIFATVQSQMAQARAHGDQSPGEPARHGDASRLAAVEAAYAPVYAGERTGDAARLAGDAVRQLQDQAIEKMRKRVRHLWL